MNINDKLKLQRELGGVLLFKEGMFLRAYNESAYILTQQLGQLLKIKCYRVKQYNNKWIAMCGFPINVIRERLPNAQATYFGWHLADCFDISQYVEWFKGACFGGGEASATDETREKFAEADFGRVSSENKNLRLNQLLSPQQIAFLTDWQRGIYPNAVTERFVESLKQQLINKNDSAD